MKQQQKKKWIKQLVFRLGCILKKLSRKKDGTAVGGKRTDKENSIGSYGKEVNDSVNWFMWFD